MKLVITDKETLDQELQKAHTTCLCILNGNSISDSDNLYHYTNIEAGLNMLTSGNLRFTDVRYCNDPSELYEGLAILSRVNDELLGEYNKINANFAIRMNYIVGVLKIVCAFDEHDHNQITDGLQRAESAGVTLGNSLPKSSVFVSCLSEHKDDLRQWIPYANNGMGMSLGFEGLKDNYHNITDSKDFDISIIKACYKSDTDKELYVRNVYKHAYQIFSQLKNQNLLQHFMARILDSFLGDIIACKHTSYCDEREWRLFFIRRNDTDADNLNFTAKDGIIKPYIDIPIVKKSVRQIVLGPKCEQKLNTNSLLKVISRHYTECRIEKSAIKFR